MKSSFIFVTVSVISATGTIALAATAGSRATTATPSVRVAQAGSQTPLYAASKAPRNYLQTTALSYQRHSITIDTKAGAVTTSTDHVETDFISYPSELSFTGFLGDKYVVRLEAVFKEETKTMVAAAGAVAATTAKLKPSGSFGLGYMATPAVEVGGRILVRRHFEEIPGANGNQKDEFTSGLYMFGPYLVFTTPLTPNIDFEASGLAAYITGGDEYKPNQGTTTKTDTSGSFFEAKGNAILAATNDLDFLAGVGLAYSNITGKSGANEGTSKDFAWTLNLATVRYKF